MKHMVQIHHKKASKRLMRNRTGARDTKRGTELGDEGTCDIVVGPKRVALAAWEEVVPTISWDNGSDDDGLEEAVYWAGDDDDADNYDGLWRTMWA